MARRVRVEDDAAADRRAGAEHDRSPRAATTGRERRSWAKRSPARATRAAVSAVPWWSMTRGGISPSGSTNHVEAEARPERSRGDEDVAAPQLPSLDAREGGGDALPGLGALDPPVVHLHAPHAHGAAAGLETELVALADRPRPQRPGRDRPDPAQREGAVDMETGRAAGVVSRDVPGDLRERVLAARRVRPRCVRSRRDHGSTGDELLLPRCARARASPPRRHRPSSARRPRARSRAAAGSRGAHGSAVARPRRRR